MTKGAIYQAEIPAKINLSLAVTGRRDGLHTLDMIVCPCYKFVDVVKFFPTEKGGIEMNCKASFPSFCPERFENFVKSKIQAVADKFGVCGIVEIEKNIPLGAGLGGSTACIVGAIKTMREYARTLGKSVSLDDGFLLSLGSDVPCMLNGGTCRVQGVGEIVTPLENDENLDFEIAVADGGADSGACYKMYDELAQKDCDKPIPTTVDEALSCLRNDLFDAACILNPNIRLAYDNLKAKGYTHVLMTGSGSAVVAIFNKSQFGAYL